MNKGESPKVYECVCGLKFPSSQYKASHCKVCAKYKEEARLGRVTQSPSVTPSATPSAMTSSSGSLGASCDSVDISLSPQDAAASLSPTPKSRTKSHGSTKREHTASPRSHLKLDRTLQQQQQQTQQGTSPLLSQLHQQQTVQQEYQRHPSLSEILKANVLTRGRTLERLDQDNYSDLHWSSHCECLLSLVPLADIIYSGPDRAQQSTNGNKLILSLEGSAVINNRMFAKTTVIRLLECLKKQV